MTEIINLAEKFIAFDGLYDTKGSHFSAILQDTDKLLTELCTNSVFNSYINTSIKNTLLANCYYVNKKPDGSVIDLSSMMLNTFFILWLHTEGHAFSMSFKKQTEDNYTCYFFNSGDGINFHRY